MTPFGHSFMHSPNFERLASQSLVFEQAHVQSQMCVPTRNSFMTGRRPMTTKVFNDGIGVANFRVTGPQWTTLPQYFKQHGYFTTGVGKSFHPNSPKNFDQPMSWSEELPYFYPKPFPCPKATDVWCAIDSKNETADFEDTQILVEGIRRMQMAVDKSQPFFLTGDSMHL
jgi:iduronate 2-sulfatase